MFRLIKVLNGNNQCETIKFPYDPSATITYGSALICSNGNLTNPSGTALPEFISVCDKNDSTKNTIDAILVTEDMIFKVEYTGNITPYVGMSVGIAAHKGKSDGVTNNSSGKGLIVGIEDDKKLVHVRFRK